MTTTVLDPASGTPTGVTVTGGGTSVDAISDDSDSTYLTFAASGEPALFTLDTLSLAAGEIVKSVQTSLRLSHDSMVAGVEIGGVLYGDTFTPEGATTITDVEGTVKTSAAVTAAVPTTLRFDRGSTTSRVYEAFVTVVHVPLPTTSVTAVSPDPYTASTIIPIAWTNTLDSDGGAQTRYQIQVTDDDDGDAVVFDTGVVISSSSSANVGPITNGNYTVNVRVAQTVNGALHWSAYATDSFELAVTTSDVDTVTPTAVNASARIDVVVARDGASSAWELIEVERSINGGTTWSPVRTATLVDSTGDANSFTVSDYEVAGSRAVTYRARATYYSSGLPITGDWVQSSSTSWTAGTEEEWLKNPLNPSLNVMIETADFGPQNRSDRSGVFGVIGAEFPVVVSDVMSSPTGSIIVRTTTRAQALALDDIVASGGVLLLNLLPDSFIGTKRDGFQYVAGVRISESWEAKIYQADGDQERLHALEFVKVDVPADGTAGSL